MAVGMGGLRDYLEAFTPRGLGLPVLDVAWATLVPLARSLLLFPGRPRCLCRLCGPLLTEAGEDAVPVRAKQKASDHKLEYNVS